MIIEHRGKHKGLAIVVKATDMGHRCGYVGVPEGHPLHGVNYDKAEDMGITAHGGLTYSDGCGDDGMWHLGFDRGMWYLGFDCAHFGDAPDPDIVADEWMPYAKRLFGEGHVWTFEEVKAECERLAESILARYH